MRVAIGSDHAGFALKGHLSETLRSLGHEVFDVGTDSEQPVDYPPICAAVGRLVATGDVDRGIVLGGVGPGRADRRQQGARRAGGAVQRSVHGTHVPRAQRRQRPLDRRPHRGRTGLADEILDAVAHDALRGRPPRAPDRPDRRDRAGVTRAPHGLASVRPDAIVTSRGSPMPWPTTPDDELFGMIDREVERQNTTIQLIASRELRVAGGAAGDGVGAHQQVQRGLPGQALLRRQRGHRPGRGPGPRRGRRRCSGPSTPTSSPTPAPTPTWPSTSPLLEPGDTVLGLRLDQGGHLTHGSPVNASGTPLPLRVLRRDAESDERIDFDQVRDLALRAPAQDHRRRRHRLPADHRPGAVPRDRRRGRGAVHVRRRPHRRARSPAASTPTRSRYADIVTFTTHKTLRGPRGGCILAGPSTPADRQGGVPRPAGRSARPRHRGQGGGLPRGRRPEFSDVRRSRS